MPPRSRFVENGENPDKKRKLTKEGFAKIRKLLAYTRPYRGYFWVGMFFLVVSTLTTLTFPTLSGKIADVASGDTSWILTSVNQVAFVFFGDIAFAGIGFFFSGISFCQCKRKNNG